MKNIGIKELQEIIMAGFQHGEEVEITGLISVTYRPQENPEHQSYLLEYSGKSILSAVNYKILNHEYYLKLGEPRSRISFQLRDYPFIEEYEESRGVVSQRLILPIDWNVGTVLKISNSSIRY